MTMSLSRQDYEKDEMAAVVPVMEESLSYSLERIETSHNSRSDAVMESLNVALVRCVGDPTAGMLETWESWLLAMQTHSAVFAATATDQETVTCKIRQEERHLATTGPQTYLNANNWLNAFYLAIICRDQPRMNAMCRIPLDLLRASGAEDDEYVHHWVDALQTYWHEQPGLLEKLTEAIEQSHPDIATNVPRDLLQCVLYPPINLFHQFLRKDEEGFNHALAEALELHKAYWSAPERAADIAGFLALGPLAIACLAYDAGLEIEVESEYLPLRLLDRSWLGEFDT